MTKFSPMGSGPQDNGKPRKPSLVERAANVYDFRAAMSGVGQASRVEFAPPMGSSAAPLPPLPPLPPLELNVPLTDAPAARGRTGTIAMQELAAGGFIVPGSPATALSEEFRIVKRQLLQTADEVTNGRTILICSARPDEGKTYCAINLALSLAAEKDLEVVLIDADVAKPEILSILGLEKGPGLLDAIADTTIDVESCLIHTDVPHLAVLPAGRQTNEATELLASARTRVVLERLRSRDQRRIIIFDSSPALAASPAGVLAMYCGQALFIVRADKTSEPEMREALELLSACPKPQMLLNGVEYGGKGRRFGRYYGYGMES